MNPLLKLEHFGQSIWMDFIRLLFGLPRYRQVAEAYIAGLETLDAKGKSLKSLEPLIGPETINTMPLETLAAYRDPGKPVSRLSQSGVKAAGTLRRLSEAGIDLDRATRQLEDEGVEKFIKAFDDLMNTLEEKRVAAIPTPVDVETFDPDPREKDIHDRTAVFERERFCARLWRKDASLWKTDAKDRRSIRNALGWLHVAEKRKEHPRMARAVCP